jgi:hypothetical protein
MDCRVVRSPRNDIKGGATVLNARGVQPRSGSVAKRILGFAQKQALRNSFGGGAPDGSEANRVSETSGTKCRALVFLSFACVFFLFTKKKENEES